MVEEKKVPKKLYKYRALDARTLTSLVAGEVYFADPSTFNDPLEASPFVEADVPLAELEQVLSELVETRVAAEMKAAAKALRYKGPRTQQHIQTLSRKTAGDLLKHVEYNSTNPDIEPPQHVAHQDMLAYQISLELQRRYSHGIFSLAKRYDCPLMWSHYGDQHRGVSIGFSAPALVVPNLYPVRYGGSRTVRASDVQAMLANDAFAQERVNEAVLLKKANDWRYEKEWRLIGSRGVTASPLHLDEIVFGMRCQDAIKLAVVKALEGLARPVKYFQIQAQSQSFLLRRYLVNVEELSRTYPRNDVDLGKMFQSLDDER